MKQVIQGEKVPIKIWTDDLEPQALEQLKNTAKLPFLFKHIAVMPDVHLGAGATIGTVIASRDAVCPAAVGVDIGCGMAAVNLNRKIDSFKDLKSIRRLIEKVIPVGHRGHKSAKPLNDHLLIQASDRIKSKWHKAHWQMGTLGGGNHFIEICDDGEGNAWLMLHSGSRNVGKSIADYHIKKAKRLMDIWHIKLADPDLAFLVKDCPEFKDYIDDVKWCQEYAFDNRQRMVGLILTALNLPIYLMEVMINCHHNYIAWENHYNTNVMITRKGAVRAREGDMGIIPASMGQPSYIVRGKGNPESFNSCSHGAGRRMSRTAARKKYTVEDLRDQTQGVECRKDADIIDEIPGAYKPISEVMKNQADLVEIVKELKAVVCVKG